MILPKEHSRIYLGYISSVAGVAKLLAVQCDQSCTLVWVPRCCTALIAADSVLTAGVACCMADLREATEDSKKTDETAVEAYSPQHIGKIYLVSHAAHYARHPRF